MVTVTQNGFMISFGSLFALPTPFRGPDPLFFHSQYALRPSWQQPSPQHVEVGQRECGKGPHRVLVDAAVAHLGKAPQALDDVEGMLAASPANSHVIRARARGLVSTSEKSMSARRFASAPAWSHPRGVSATSVNDVWRPELLHSDSPMPGRSGT